MGFYQVKQKAALWLALVFVAVLTFIFRDASIAILQSWSQEEYSHGYMIPPLALLLLLNQMSNAKIAPQSSWLGFAFITAGVSAGFLFQFSGITHLLPVLYVVSIIGIVVVFLGTRTLRTLAGPLILLFFAVPLPKFFYYALSSQMQMWSTTLGVAFLTLLGTPVFQDGNIIDLGGYKLNVVEACSGVRYLFPLLSLSFLLAYLYKAPRWKRITLFLSTGPIAILLNSMRIALIGVTVDKWGPSMAEGFIHDFEGFVIFILGFLFLLLEIWLLQKVGAKGVLRLDDLRLPSVKRLPLPATGKPVVASGVFLVLAVLLSAALPTLLPRYLSPVYLRQSFSSFPLQIGEWVWQSSSVLGEKELAVLGTNDYLLSNYAKLGKPSVNLYALYYPQQDSSSNEAVHTPTVCIPGGGWTVEGTAPKVLPVTDPASAQRKPLTVNRLMISKGDTRQVVYYWYAQANHSTTKAGETRLYTMLNSLTLGHTNGALLRVTTMMERGEKEGDGENRLNAFLTDSLPLLSGYMFGGTAP